MRSGAAAVEQGVRADARCARLFCQEEQPAVAMRVASRVPVVGQPEGGWAPHARRPRTMVMRMVLDPSQAQEGAPCKGASSRERADNSLVTRV